jgi:hypothetical protein
MHISMNVCCLELATGCPRYSGYARFVAGSFISYIRIRRENVTIFWYIAPYSPYVSRCFGGKYHFHLQGLKLAEKEIWKQQAPSFLLHAGFWNWKWYFPPKRRFTNVLHGCISQKITFIYTSVRTATATKRTTFLKVEGSRNSVCAR